MDLEQLMDPRIPKSGGLSAGLKSISKNKFAKRKSKKIKRAKSETGRDGRQKGSVSSQMEIQKFFLPIRSPEETSTPEGVPRDP